MKTISLEGISNMDFPALKSVLEYWKEYEKGTLLLCYAELKRRGFAIDEKSMKKLNEISLLNNYSSIDDFLTSYIKKQGFNSYVEYFDNEIGLSKNEKLKLVNKKQETPTTVLKSDSEVHNELLKELISAQKLQNDKLERIRANTSKLVWWLVAIPILIVLFSLLFGGCSVLSLFLK
jgi:hypothetical protein